MIRKPQEQLFWALAVGTLSILVLLRFLPMLRFFILVFLFLALLGLVGVWWYSRQKQLQAEKAFQDSPEGKTRQKITYCEQQLAKNRQELQDIEKHIQELEAKTVLDENNRKNQETLLKGFKEEWQLRTAKEKFFQTCIQKLNTFLHNQETARELAAKKEQLRALQSDHYEELARLEHLRSDLEIDILVLDEIDTLSLKTFESTSLRDVEDLLKELENMTGNMEKL